MRQIYAFRKPSVNVYYLLIKMRMFDVNFIRIVLLGIAEIVSYLNFRFREKEIFFRKGKKSWSMHHLPREQSNVARKLLHAVWR